MSKRQPKKQRVQNLLNFGAPSEADLPSAQNNNPSSSASSTRSLPIHTVPALTTLCGQVFMANFVKLRSNEATSGLISAQLTALPDVIIPKIFAMLRNYCPTYLSHGFIVSHFFRGHSITLRKDLPGVGKRTILDIPRFNPGVRELELSGFDDISDQIFSSLFQELTALRSLILRGCTKVGAETARAVARCPDLRVLNLSYTSVSPVSLVPVVSACRQLEILKLAGIQNWTDATISNLFTGIEEGLTLPNLRALKLRQTSLSDSSLTHILGLCPALQRLDVSFTLVRHPSPMLGGTVIPALQKLSLTSTAISAADLLDIIGSLPALRTLAIGALGDNRGLRTSIGNTSAMTMTDDSLRALSDIMESFLHLENITLVGNTKLGMSSKGGSALSYFVTRVGRKCKKLNLAGITQLRSSDLAGLVPTEATSTSTLETLILNNTGVDDEAGLYISTCSFLGTLGVAGTKFTDEGLFPVIDSCPRLENLDLTSCRGVRVVDRRQFFEVWEEARR